METQVGTIAMEQYIKMLGVFYSEWFLDSDQKETLRGLCQGINIPINVIS